MIILDDSEIMEDPYSPVCSFCKHVLGTKKCKAFPQGIPAEIWEGENRHTSPYPGDNGIQFEKYEVTDEQ